MATNREELKSRQGAMLLLDDKKGKPLSSVGSRAPSQQTVTFSPGFNTVTPMASGVRWDGEQPGAAAAAIAASGGARGAAAMTESRPRGLETHDPRQAVLVSASREESRLSYERISVRVRVRPLLHCAGVAPAV